MKFYTDVKNGKITSRTKNQIAEYIQKCEGQEIVIDISQDIDTRTTSQNKRYWANLLPQCLQAFQDLGIEEFPYEIENVRYNFFIEQPSDLHELFKIMFNQKDRTKKINGVLKTRKQVASTSKLNKQDFAEYVEKIVRFMNENFNTTINF
jgi:uncharacterized protein YaaW (UPF0174 family)